MIKGFTPKNLYRNINCLDIDFLINRIKYRGLNYTIADLTYINRNKLIIGSEKNIKIYHKNLKHWSYIDIL